LPKCPPRRFAIEQSLEFLPCPCAAECPIQSSDSLGCYSKKLIGVGEFLSRKSKEDRLRIEVESSKKTEEEFLLSIGGEPEDEPELDIGLSDVEFFYLDSDKAEVFELYKLARLYQTAADNLDPTLIQMLCKTRNKGRKRKEKLSLEEVLTNLALIHYGVWKENERTRKLSEPQTGED